MPAPEELPAGDWDVLFAAVLCRARATLDAVPSADAARATLRDCMGELEQLHAALALERRRSEQTRLALQQTSAALAAAQAELALLHEAAAPPTAHRPCAPAHTPGPPDPTSCPG